MATQCMRPVFLPYGEIWRRTRKLMHALTNTNVSISYQSLQEQESIRVLHDLIKDPQEYERWFERYSASLLLDLAYSERLYTGREPKVQAIFQVVHGVERVASPGAYHVNTFPFLMYLPYWLAPFKREGARMHAQELNLFRSLLKSGSEAKPKDAGRDNFAMQWSKKRDSYGLTEDQAAYAVGTLFEGGAGTTSAAMMSFMLAMTLHPGEFLKMQQEVDSVIDDSRLPTFFDIPSLPRVRAVAKETLRWRPVTAGGLPHMSTKDDVYTLDGQKYFIPAGSNVHPVQWSIHRDQARYPAPDDFRPERWLESGWPTYKEPLETYPNMHNFSAFGFGRRICPGQSIAERSMYILIARFAWGCDVTKLRDEKGVEITPPSYEYTSGFNVQPKRFPFALKSRPQRESRIAEEYISFWKDGATSSDR